MNLTFFEFLGIGVGVIVIRNLLKAHEKVKESREAENLVVNPTTIPNLTIEHEGHGLINQIDKQNRQGEPYPIAYDPVNDFLPRYRWPDGTVWSPDYNPVDSFRPLDYQVSQIGESYYV